ncbi:MAG TPA: reverse transcriptase domain-containing protein [Ktedonobacteraceae bacterium]|jgi:group II intron reverse transcriptase/maturase
MRSTDTILGLIQERGRKGLPLERVHRLLYNPNLYLTAYGKIYSNKGAMTPGSTKETADAMSLEKIAKIIQSLREGTFQWTPARRKYIPKKGGKKRPLGITSWTDKLIQEVMRMILEAYFEPCFNQHSHGFRPERGCHTALREVYYQWSGTVWHIEGDISQCFDAVDHHILLTILRESIHDEKFIALISELLKAGYMEQWRYHTTLSGTPQGSILSPVLANLYLDKLDTYIEKTLVPAYTRGERRRANPEYRSLNRKANNLRKQGQMKEAKELKKQYQRIPSSDTNDPNFRRLRYIRYADDILLGFIGPKSDAEDIKRQLGTFLQETLRLKLSNEKTLITHASSERAKFLGYEIQTLQSTTSHDERGRRNINGRIGLRVPEDVIYAKRKRYTRKGKAIHRTELLQDSDFSIITMYQAEYRGLVEYYRLAYNLSPALNKLKARMEESLVKTLAAKYKVSKAQIYKRYRTTIVKDEKRYKGLKVLIERSDKQPLVAQWGGIPLTWDIQASIKDQTPRWNDRRTELEKRLLADTCEYCGSTENVQVHHIRALKDLQRHTGREKPEWVKMMAARRRKTLILCRTCHMDVHSGRPLRRQKSST